MAIVNILKSVRVMLGTRNVTIRVNLYVKEAACTALVSRRTRADATLGTNSWRTHVIPYAQNLVRMALVHLQTPVNVTPATTTNRSIHIRTQLLVNLIAPVVVH